MRKAIIFCLLISSGTVSAQSLWGGYLFAIKSEDGDTLTKTNLQAIADFVRQTTTGRSTGQTAAVASVATLTVGAADASYMVSGNVLVTTSSGELFSIQVDFTDEGNTARTVTIPIVLAGTAGSSIRFQNGAIAYPCLSMQIRCKASTSITIKTSGTFTGCTYNVEGRIQKI